MNEEIVKAGQAAKLLLQNPTLQEAFQTIEDALTEQWRNTASPNDREEVWYTLKGLERFRSILTATVESGELEQQLGERYE